ncbi:MAG: GAF domain-containing protein [Promethearchaeota archaeon]
MALNTNKDYSRLLDELKLKEETLQSLLELIQLKDYTIKELVDYTLEECVRLTKSKAGYLHFINSDQNSLELYTWSNDVLKFCTAEKTSHYSIDQAGVWADCFRIRAPVIHNDYPNLPNRKGYPEGHFPVNRHMSVPIFDGNNIVAIIGVGNKDDLYNDEDTYKLSLFVGNMWKLIMHKRIEKRVVESEAKYREAFKQTEFYKDLFVHDISNILQNIQSSIGIFPMLLKKGGELEKIDKLIDIINDQVNRGSKLIDNVRKLSLIDEKSPELERVELYKVLGKAIKFIKKSFPSRIINIIVSEKKKEIFILADNFLLELFENIMINSVKHNENERVDIEIKVSRKSYGEEMNVKIEIIDNGIGIPDVMKNQIIEGNYQKREGSEGMGLGLMLVRNLIKKYDAKFYIFDKIKGDHPQGTNVTIVFPEIK